MIEGRARRWRQWLLPKGLFGRALLILLVPVVATQIVVTLVFIERHLDGVTREMSAAMGRELRGIATVIEAQPDADAVQRLVTQMSSSLGYDMRYAERDFIDPQERRPFYRITARAIIEALQRETGYPISVDTERSDKEVHVAVQLSEGVLRADLPRRRLTTRNPHFLIVWMVSVALFLIVVATLFLRNQVRPLRQLASAAEAFGKGQPAPAFKAAGADEVRRAGTAFLTMRSRIERQIAQRTLMLSGVSHDLRTPLTRMRLALAMLDDEEEARPLLRDVDEMERMVEGFLAFARGESAEIAVPTDLADLTGGVVRDARAMGRIVAYSVEGEDTVLSLRPDAIRRCLGNLIENAAKYGGGRVWVSLRAESRRVTVEVEDDGPGVPADRREDIVKPFTRGDAARNQDRGGGTGLGLSIARDAARAHGGDLILSGSERGGLSALVTLPR